MSEGSPSAPESWRPQARRRIGEVLVSQGAITEEQLRAALAAQANIPPGMPRKRLGTVIVESRYATERQVAEALGSALNLDVVDLARVTVNPQIVRLIPQAVAMRAGVLVLDRLESGGLQVAMADPTNVVALDDVKIYTGVPDVAVAVAAESQIRDFIGRAWSITEGNEAMASILDDYSSSGPAAEVEDGGLLNGADEAPLVKLINEVMADAVRARASDIHIQPEQYEVRIRYRVDGVLRDVMAVPKTAAPGLVSRVKVMASLDIAERRVPQDGRTRITVDGASMDTRISTLPGMHGEKVVIRLLSRPDTVPVIKDMGFEPDQLDAMLRTLDSPQGLILITGPTGSGKTNTLYAAINHIVRPEINIITLEDPVEIQVPGITQVQTNERAGLTFQRGLRSILRQDPDVVLVGEVRDGETAHLAMEASLTGHLVLTTVHTNSAPAALTRLVDMGVAPFLVASSLSLVVGQRLARRPCASCIESYRPSDETMALLGITDADLAKGKPRRGAGCVECGGTGYRGRLGIFEVLPVTAAMRQVLLGDATEKAVARAARDAGMSTLRESGLAKAFRGETTFEEVIRVTSADAGDETLRCPDCRGEVADDMVACPWCAAHLSRSSCEMCGRPAEPSWVVCPWCRHSTGLHPTHHPLLPESQHLRGEERVAVGD